MYIYIKCIYIYIIINLNQSLLHQADAQYGQNNWKENTDLNHKAFQDRWALRKVGVHCCMT